MSGFYSKGENFDRIFFTDYQMVDRFVGNRLFSFGRNTVGGLGNSSTTARSSPGDVAGIGSTWKSISVGTSTPTGSNDFAAGIKTDGTLWTWGAATYGSLGSGTTTSRSSPVTVTGGGTTWDRVSCGTGFATSIKNDGSLWSWGRGSEGQLGAGAGITSRSSPATAIGGGLASSVLYTWADVCSGNSHSLALSTDGAVYSSGTNLSGELGRDSSILSSFAFQALETGAGADDSYPYSFDWAKIAAGDRISAAIKTDGTLWTWGKNTTGELGNGTTTSRSSPGTTSGGGTNWKAISCGFTFMAGVKVDGTLWTWGNNAGAGLGDGTTTNRSSPVTISGGGTTWKNISCGAVHSGGVKTDGSVWLWGNNANGQLGDGTTTTRSSPVTVTSGIVEWQSVDCSGSSTGGQTLGLAYFI